MASMSDTHFCPHLSSLREGEATVAAALVPLTLHVLLSQLQVALCDLLRQHRRRVKISWQIQRDRSAPPASEHRADFHFGVRAGSIRRPTPLGSIRHRDADL